MLAARHAASRGNRHGDSTLFTEHIVQRTFIERKYIENQEYSCEYNIIAVTKNVDSCTLQSLAVAMTTCKYVYIIVSAQ